MNIIYSCVVDASAQFLPQTRTFLASLLATGVPAAHIVAQITPTAGPAVRSLVQEFGVTATPLTPCLDGKYCNKIAQLDYLQTIDCDCVVLCDTDIAFAQNLSRVVSATQVVARPVDFANPPLAILETLRKQCGIKAVPVLADTACSTEQTYQVNCNGGMYALPRALLAPIQHAWFQFARYALQQHAMLGRWAHHADQIGFALAMLQLECPFKPLPLEYNFPTHCPEAYAGMHFDNPAVLHYHGAYDVTGVVTRTGHPQVDAVVDAINQRVATFCANMSPTKVTI